MESQEASESSGSGSDEEDDGERNNVHGPSQTRASLNNPPSSQPPPPPPPQPSFDRSPNSVTPPVTHTSLHLGTVSPSLDASGLLHYANDLRIGRSNWVRFATSHPSQPPSRRGSSVSVVPGMTPATAPAEGDYFSLSPPPATGPGNLVAPVLDEGGKALGNLPPPSPSLITVSRRLRTTTDDAPQQTSDSRRKASVLAACGVGGITPIHPPPTRQSVSGLEASTSSRRESDATALSLTPTPSRKNEVSREPALHPASGPAPAPAPAPALVPAPAPASRSQVSSPTIDPASETSFQPNPPGSESTSTALPRATLRRGVSRSMVELKSHARPPHAARDTDSTQNPSTDSPQLDTRQSTSVSSESMGTDEDGSSHVRSRTRSSSDTTSPEDESSRRPSALAPSREHEAGESSAGLRKPRRQSMSAMDTEPPAYTPDLYNRPVIVPREEEGREFLPSYTARVHLEGYLPRKMEFSAPGIQSRDRSWRRYYFVLHGTFLKVYKGDMSTLVPRQTALEAFTPMEGVHVHPDPINEDESPASSSTAASGVAATASHAAQSARGAFQRHSHGLPHIGGSTTNHSDAPSDGQLSAMQIQRQAMAEPQGSLLASLKSGAYVNQHAVGSDPYGANLSRAYSLQGAESGLAADYIKRKNIIRVRLQGEQFLIQCRDPGHVVSWIEALQAATNVSLDLDQRQMPKFITLPRRRRRRRNEDVPPAQRERMLAAREAAQIAEAQRRSLSDLGRLTEAALLEPAVPETVHESAGEEEDSLTPARRSLANSGPTRRHDAPRVTGSGMSYRTSHDLPSAHKYTEV